MKKNTFIKIFLALFLILVNLPFGVDLFPDFIGFVLLLFAATSLVRLHKNMWWLRCAFLALSALTFVTWIWQPSSAFITIPVGLVCAAMLFMFMISFVQLCEKYAPVSLALFDKLVWTMLVIDVIHVLGAGLMGSLFFIWASIINLILMVLIDIRLYSAYCAIFHEE